MPPHTPAAPAGFIDPALASAPDVATLREELAHAFEAALGSRGAEAPTPELQTSTGARDEDANRLAHVVRLLQQLVARQPQATPSTAAGAPVADRPAPPRTPQHVALTIRVQRRGGSSADVSLPEAWSAELLRALAALVEGRGVQWAATADRLTGAPPATYVPAAVPPATNAAVDVAGAAPELVGSTDDEIGTGELARVLGVSVPTAAAVLDRGDIPSRRTSERGHRRVSRAAALEWRRRREVQAAALRTLVRMAEADEADGPSLPAGVRGDPDDESDLSADA